MARKGFVSSWLRRATEVPPYSQLAFIYDSVMRHVDYGAWAYYLSELFLRADVDVREVVDISCGTANLLLRLSDLDYRVAGFDESENMVRVARHKILQRFLNIPVWCASMTSFALRRPVQAVVSTYDSINYCMNLETWSEVFTHALDALCIGGVFIFDICTERNSRRNFQNYYDDGRCDRVEYNRHSYYLRRERVQVNEFLIQPLESDKALYREVHRQRIYKISEIREVVPSQYFDVVGIYDGFTFRPGTEKSDRVHFVLKKKADVKW